MNATPQPAARSDASDAPRSRTWWIHPLLAGAFPVIFLFAQNIGEQTSLNPLWLPLLVVVGGAAAMLAVALLVGWAVGVDRQRAALVASLAIVLAMTYGHAWAVVGEALHLHRYLLIAWAGLAILGVLVVLRLGPTAATRATVGLTALVALLVAFNLPPVVALGIRTGALAAGEPTGSSDAGVEATGPGAGRDVWYVVLDRYAGAIGLRETFGFDNRPFLDELTRRGFVIAEEATANYLKTALSLASSLNMEELDFEAFKAEASAGDDWAPVYRWLQGDHAVGRFLKDRGYRYLHLGSLRGPTAVNTGADATILYGRTSEFSSVLSDTTILVALSRVLPAAAVSGIEEVIPAQTEFQLETFDRLADEPGLNFVFAHMLLPHPPYAFNADGTRVTDAQRASRSPDEQYLEQLKFANASMLELVDRLHEGPESEWPIIVIASDEGPFPPRYAAHEDNFQWLEATPEELTRKFSILLAIDVPGLDRAHLEPAGFTDRLTPVNLFRVTFNAAFDAELPMRPNHNWAFIDHGHLYDEFDITDRVQR